LYLYFYSSIRALGYEKKKNSEELRIVPHKILQTINRQVLDLASFVAFFNTHQLISNPKEKSFTITIGRLQYTRSFEILKRLQTYMLKEKYWRNFFYPPLERYSSENFIMNKRKITPPKPQNYVLLTSREGANRVPGTLGNDVIPIKLERCCFFVCSRGAP
jgi:hypothetical protein